MCSLSFLFLWQQHCTKHVIFASNVLVKRKCKAYTCLSHEIYTHFSVCHLKSGKYQNQVSPLSSIYGRNAWRLFKEYLQAKPISIFKKLFIIWKGRYVMTNDVPQTSNTFLDNSKLAEKDGISLQWMLTQIASHINFCLSIFL